MKAHEQIAFKAGIIAGRMALKKSQTITINKGDWSGQEVTLNIDERKSKAKTPDFEIFFNQNPYSPEQDPGGSPPLNAIVDWDGDTAEFNVFRSGDWWTATSGSHSRQEKNPYEAVAQLVYTIW